MDLMCFVLVSVCFVLLWFVVCCFGLMWLSVVWLDVFCLGWLGLVGVVWRGVFLFYLVCCWLCLCSILFWFVLVGLAGCWCCCLFVLLLLLLARSGASAYAKVFAEVKNQVPPSMEELRAVVQTERVKAAAKRVAKAAGPSGKPAAVAEAKKRGRPKKAARVAAAPVPPKAASKAAGGVVPKAAPDAPPKAAPKAAACVVPKAAPAGPPKDAEAGPGVALKAVPKVAPEAPPIGAAEVDRKAAEAGVVTPKAGITKRRGLAERAPLQTPHPPKKVHLVGPEWAKTWEHVLSALPNDALPENDYHGEYSYSLHSKCGQKIEVILREKCFRTFKPTETAKTGTYKWKAFSSPTEAWNKMSADTGFDPLPRK